MAAWRQLESEGDARVAGLRVTLIAEFFDPVEVRFVAVAGRARVAHLRLAAIAKSSVSADTALPAGTTLDVFTVPGFRGIGIARLLWPWAAQVTIAEQMNFRPLHSPSRTHAGQVYAESVGGDIPALQGGRYAECPDLLDPTNALWRARQHLNLEARRPRNETAGDDADDRVARRGGRRLPAMPGRENGAG